MMKHIIFLVVGYFFINSSVHAEPAQDFKTASFRSTDLKEIIQKRWYCSSNPLNNTYAGTMEYLMSGHDAFKLIEEDGRIRNFGNHVAKDFEFVPDQSVLRGKVNNHSSNAYAFIRLKNGKIIYQWATDSDSNLWSNLPKSELIKNGKVLSTAVCESEADLQSNLARFGCSPVQIEQLMAGVKFFRSSRQLSFNCHT